jgi:tetratricopeptide (TPR) repeat protein
VASRVNELESGLTGGPSDLASYRELAELYLASERFTEAFDAAAKALGIDPSDAPSLYVQGVVRYMMGQPGEAIDLLDRSLASDPSNTQAASLKGLFLIQMEDRVGALDTWETALEAAGGSDAQLEHLIGLTREGRSVEEILNSPPPTSSD